jgi:hypothetical protein
VERGDELRRGLAVEGSAALFEELGLLVEVRVLVELEEAGLDLHDLLGAGLRARALVL